MTTHHADENGTLRPVPPPMATTAEAQAGTVTDERSFTPALIKAAILALAVYLTSVARTATADGTGTGTVAAAGFIQLVTVTSDDANKIVILPAPTPGTILILRNGATGYELRTSTPASISINGGAGANAESAIPANAMVLAICTTATTWQAIQLAGTTLAAVEAAA